MLKSEVNYSGGGSPRFSCGEVMTDKIYKYVPHYQAKAYELAGWEYECELGLPHSVYASLYVWPLPGEPVIPEFPEVRVAKKSEDQ